MDAVPPAPVRILIVEDSTSMRIALREYVQRFVPQARIEEAATGSEAVAATAREVPDIVLLDLGLPDIDGTDLCARLRAISSGNLRVIVVTWLAGEAYVERAERAGASAFIHKDRLLDEIIPAIQKKLRVGA